jgi:hypothetical protein
MFSEGLGYTTNPGITKRDLSECVSADDWTVAVQERLSAYGNYSAPKKPTP